MMRTLKKRNESKWPVNKPVPKNNHYKRVFLAEYKDQGNAHFKNGTFDKAVECYTMAQSLDISNPVYPANRAMANLKLKNWKEAEEDCTRALRHDPTYEKALFRR